MLRIYQIVKKSGCEDIEFEFLLESWASKKEAETALIKFKEENPDQAHWFHINEIKVKGILKMFIVAYEFECWFEAKLKIFSKQEEAENFAAIEPGIVLDTIVDEIKES